MRPKAAFGYLWSDDRGLAALEFALVAPALILLGLGLCDIVPAWLAYGHVGVAASTAADLVGEFSQMQPADMASVYFATADAVAPLSGKNETLRITSISSDGQGNAKVYWSCGEGNLPAYAAWSSSAVTPQGVAYARLINAKAANASYIVAEISYAYTAPAQFVLKSPIALHGVAFYLPRLAAYVGFPWDGSASDPPIAPAATTGSASVQLSNGAQCNYAK